MPHTFATLRNNLTPPSAEAVAAAIENELRGLAAEFGKTLPGSFPDPQTQAIRLACDALVKMDRGGSLSALLVAYRLGEQNTVMSALGQDRNAALELAADMISDAADTLSEKWRGAMREVS